MAAKRVVKMKKKKIKKSKLPAVEETKKKRKETPGNPQPQRPLPPPAGNSAANGKTKTAEEVKQEFEDRMAVIKLLKHQSLHESMKSAPPALLLTLVGGFLTAYGFNSTSRLFTLERKTRKRLDGWEGVIGQKLEKGTPDLVKIFQDWQKHRQEVLDLETSSDGEDSSSDDSPVIGEKSLVPTLKYQAADGQETEEIKVTRENGVASEASESEESDDSDDSDDSEDSDDSDSSENSDDSTGSSDSEDLKASESSDSPQNVVGAVESRLANMAPRQTEARAEGDTSEASFDQPSAGSSTTLNNTPPLLEPQRDQVASSDDTSASASSSSDDEPVAASLPPSKMQQQPKRKRSASPNAMANRSSKVVKRTSKPFSRVPDDVPLDPRLASNAYVPYDYAERAHQDLIVTKGKEFTKEKNKKKRGSYRGGTIDTSGGKAIKFDDDGN